MKKINFKVNQCSIDNKTVIVEDEQYLALSSNGFNHNLIYRGKDLGIITSDNLENFLVEHEVASGKFTDLYLGDTFILQDGTYNKEWIIAGFDTELNQYIPDGNYYVSKHHLTLIPVTALFDDVMNDSDTTAGGYAGSKMHTKTIPTIVNNLKNLLGTHLIERGAILTTSVTNTIPSAGYAGWSGASSNWAWYTVYATLMSEIQVYGSNVWSSSGYDTGEANSQLPLFRAKEYKQISIQYFWLKNVVNSPYFACAIDGGSYYLRASYSLGVRPLICVG